MKNNIKLLLIGLLCLGMTTGCMKANVEMKIKADKSMKISTISAISDELFKMAEESGSDAGSFSSISDEELEDYRKRGYEVEDYKENGYTGVKVTKSIKNIDEISSKEPSNDSIMNIFEENPQKQYYFVVKLGFFKNQYKAVFKTQELTSEVPDTSTYENVDSDELGLDTEQIKELTRSMESKFVLTLPKRAISNNADVVSEDGKTLTWNFIQDNPKETIEFEFELINRGSTYSTIVGVSLLILLIIITLVSTRKPKKKTNPVKIEKDSLESDELGEVDLDGENMNNKIRENLSI